MGLFDIFKKHSKTEPLYFDRASDSTTEESINTNNHEAKDDVQITSDTPSSNQNPYLSLLINQLLDDIRKVQQSYFSRYDFTYYEDILNGKYPEQYTLLYDPIECVYDLTHWDYYEKGHIEYSIREQNIDEFRFSFLCHEFFFPRCSKEKDYLVAMLCTLWPLFDDKAFLIPKIEAHQIECKLDKLDFDCLANNAEKLKDFSLLIPDDNFDHLTSLCVHKTTSEVYVIHKEQNFGENDQQGEHIDSQISSISIASLEEIDSMVKKEFDYKTFLAHHGGYYKIRYKKLIIAQKAYRIECFVVIDGIEVPQGQIWFGSTVLGVPPKFLTKDQCEKYKEFFSRPGPYEFIYDLPEEYCQKVVRKLVSYDSGK